MKLHAIALAGALLLAQGPALAAPALPASTPVTLNFVNADVEAVSRAMANMIGQPILVDPRVKGVVTLYSEQPIKTSDAYAQYLAALRGLGFSVVNVAGLLKVVPEADAKLQATGVLVGEEKARGDQVLTQVFALRHENANNLVAVLRPLVNVNNTINANPGNNSLVITDYADNLQRIAKIIAALDTPAATDVEVLPLQHQVASELAPLVQRLDSGGAVLPGVPVAGAGGGTTVLADPRGNALILRAPNAARLQQLKKLVQQLDVPVPGGGAANIRVVHLKNADAVKLAQVLRAAFAAQTSSSSANALAGLGTASMASGAAVAPTPGAPISASPIAAQGGGFQSQAATTPVGQSQGPSTGGNVQADPSTNSLIVTAPEPLYRQMRQVIDQLDTRRAQVYVEAIIVKVDAAKAAQLGVQWQAVFGRSGNNAGLAGVNSGVAGGNILNLIGGLVTGGADGAKAVAGSIASGFNLGLAHKTGSIYSLGAIANFLESQTGGNVLSAPNLVALDNEEAKIVVGQNVPFVTGSFAQGTGSTGTVNPFTTVERKDVGLVLRVKNQIGEGGAIRMTVTTENSAISPSSTASALITDKSEIQTTVAVDDGGILVLGGLMKDEYTDVNDGMPGLSKIPVLGYLFKSEKRERKKTNLMVFLRPTVLRNADETAQFMLDRYEQIRAAQTVAQPEAKAALPDLGAPVLPERTPPAKAPGPQN